MLTLAVETSQSRLGVALTADETPLCVLQFEAGRQHGRRLGTLAATVLEESGVHPEDVDAVAFGRGPGSFTGIRIGAAFAGAFAHARDIPAVGVGALDALAGGVLPFPGRVAACIDARHGRCYAALYAGDSLGPPPGRTDAGGLRGRLEEPAVWKLEDWADRLSQEPGPVCVVGDGSAPLEAVWGAPPRHCVFVANRPDAATIGRLGTAMIQDGAVGDPRRIRPLYLRAPAPARNEASGTAADGRSDRI